MTTNAASITKSSPGPSQTGTQLQPSAQAVAAQEIQTGLECSEQTVRILVAIIQGMFYHTLSGDTMHLALIQAEDALRKQGIPEKEFERVRDILLRHWKTQRSRSPLSGMF